MLEPNAHAVIRSVHEKVGPRLHFCVNGVRAAQLHGAGARAADFRDINAVFMQEREQFAQPPFDAGSLTGAAGKIFRMGKLPGIGLNSQERKVRQQPAR